MSSTGPSPLFVPLSPSPRLVAQMTGLSLRQSELEVAQQRNLKRMIRRIRASRVPRHHVGASPRTAKLASVLRKTPMPSLSLPAAEVNRPPPVDDSPEWSDDPGDDGLSLRKMHLTMDIADAPSPEELARRVATLFNDVFEPEPSIAPEHVGVARLSGAMTNCVFMVTVTPAPHVAATAAVTAVLRSSSVMGEERVQLPTKYLLRVYGAGVDEFLSRDKELYWLSQLTSLGFGPRLYGIFGNGRLEEFLESTTLTRADIRNPSTSKHIARRMCELHSLVSYYRPFGGQPSTNAVDLSGAPELWANVAAWLRLVEKKWARIRHVCANNPQCLAILDNWPRVQQAVAKLRVIVARANSPVVFAHDDLQYGNILRLEGTGELVVVDFEYAGYNYRGFDIANHFCEWMADYHGPQPHTLAEDWYPTLDHRKAFLRTYVKAKAFLDANMKADKGVVENDRDHVKLRRGTLGDDRIKAEIDLLEREVVHFVPASHLHWGVWGLLQACSSEIDFDYVSYAAQRLSIFLRMVEEF